METSEAEVLEKPPVTNNEIINNIKKCKTKAGMPPIKDKSKLKKMLIDNGTITAEMSEEKANKMVNDYIKKKQEAFKRCKK